MTVTPPPTGTTTVVVTCDSDPTPPAATFQIPVHGDTASALVPSGMLLRNGYYTFTANVGVLGAVTPTTAHILLDAPPQAPKAVTVTAAPDGHSVNVTWQPGGSEPDISGFTVERTGGSGPKITFHVDSTRRAYLDVTTVPGVMYTYDVLAERPDINNGHPDLVSIISNQPVVTTPSGPSSPAGGNKPGGVQGSHGGGARIGGGGGVTGSLGGGGGSLRIGGNGGVTGSFSKPSLGTSKPITGAPTLGGFQGTLPYGQSSVALGGQPNASRSTSPAKEDGPHGYPVWTIALAVLLLAAAGFLFTLRRRIAKEKPALEPVQTSRRPAMRTSGTDFTNPRR